MKVATAAYDRNNVLVMPPKFFSIEDHPQLSKFTTEGGYWHYLSKYYFDTRTRDMQIEDTLERLEVINGTCSRLKTPTARRGETEIYGFEMLYIVEEPDHIPYKRMSATVDKTGIDPDFVYPYDGVAEHGPEYRTPHRRKAAYQAAAVGAPEMVTPLPTVYRSTPQDKVPRHLPPPVDEPEFGKTSAGQDYAYS